MRHADPLLDSRERIDRWPAGAQAKPREIREHGLPLFDRNILRSEMLESGAEWNSQFSGDLNGKERMSQGSAPDHEVLRAGRFPAAIEVIERPDIPVGHDRDSEPVPDLSDRPPENRRRI